MKLAKLCIHVMQVQIVHNGWISHHDLHASLAILQRALKVLRLAAISVLLDFVPDSNFLVVVMLGLDIAVQSSLLTLEYAAAQAPGPPAGPRPY